MLAREREPASISPTSRGLAEIAVLDQDPDELDLVGGALAKALVHGGAGGLPEQTHGAPVELVIAVGGVAEVATADAEIERYIADAVGKLVA